MRGRVMALRVGIAHGDTPIGAPIVGWVADHEGPRWAMAIVAASGIIAATIGVFARREIGGKQVGTRPIDRAGNKISLALQLVRRETGKE